MSIYRKAAKRIVDGNQNYTCYAIWLKKLEVIEADQWFSNGSHPKDNCETFFDKETGQPCLGEGKVVRYFRHPRISGESICSRCGNTMRVHGWIDNSDEGHTVCPKDWIIKGRNGKFYPCKPDIFELTYEVIK